MTRYVLACDPGLATGLCFFSKEDDQDPVLLYSWEVTFATLPALARWALENYPNTEVVCEKFTVSQRTAKLSAAPYSLEQIGALKLIMQDFGQNPDHLPLQTPADAKNMWPNAYLKKLGYWHVGGAGHALDSIRHALLYFVRTGWSAESLLD